MPESQTCVNCHFASAKSTHPRCVACAAGKPSEYPMWTPKEQTVKEVEQP